MTVNDRFNLPISSPQDEEGTLRSQLVKLLCIYCAAALSIYGLVFYFLSGQTLILITAQLFAALFFVLLYLTSKLHYRLTSALIQVLGCCIMMFYGVLLGNMSQMQYVSVFMMSISVLLFKPDDRLFIFGSTLLPILCLFLLELNFYFHWIGPLAFSAGQQLEFRWLILLIVLLLNFLLVLLYQKKMAGLLNKSRHLFTELSMRNQYLKTQAASLEAQVTQRTQELNALVQELQAANKFKTLFLRENNHEIRNSVNGIAGFSELLLKHKTAPFLSPKQETEFLEGLYCSSEHLRTIVNNVLDYSKLDAGVNIDLQPESFHLRDWLIKCAGVYQVLGKEKNLRIEYQVDDGLPLLLHADKTRLTQILFNLLSNALKFTPRNKAIFIRCYLQEDRLGLSICDEGIGIAPEILPSIFDDFASHARYEGTGLGLGIVKRLITLMGGDISVTSTEGKGTCFFIQLPLYASPVTQPAPYRPLNKTAGR